jgi:cytochrome c-type biogenesis protein CcsB
MNRVCAWFIPLVIGAAFAVAGGQSVQPIEAPPAPFADAVDLAAFGALAVHSQGRVKSFESYASSYMSLVSGPRRIDGRSPAFTYLDMMIRSDHYLHHDVVYIKMKQIRAQIIHALEAAGMDGTMPDFRRRMRAFMKTGLISQELLSGSAVQMVFSQLRTDLMRTAGKIEDIETAMSLTNPRLLRGNLTLAPDPRGGFDDPWMTLDDLAAAQAHAHEDLGLDPQLHGLLVSQWTEFIEGWREGDAARVNGASAQLAALLPQVNPELYPAPSRLGWESWYFRSHNMTWVWMIYLLALVPLLASVAYRWPAAHWVGLGMFAVAFGLHTFAVMLRWYVAERWPNSNMFEAVTTAAWFGGCFAMLMEVFVLRRTPMRNLFALGSAVASMVALMCAKFLPLQLNPSISNMMPVLHDVWLYIHTNVIIFSYCLIFLAAVTATLYLARRGWMWMRGAEGTSEFARVGGAGSLMMTRPDGSSNLAGDRTTFGQVLDGSTMILMELAFILLWSGLVMGAIWADHSWGRPWGWDPKEVFALNTFLVFLVLVHVRLKVRDKGLWTAFLAFIGCIVMLFNWIVINFTIAGLHSYA